MLLIDSGLDDPCAPKVASLLLTDSVSAVDGTLMSFDSLMNYSGRGIVVLHADILSEEQLQELKWHHGSFITCRTNANQFVLDFSILVGRTRHSQCQMLMSFDGSSRRDVDPVEEGERRKAERMQKIISSSTFDLHLNDEAKRAKAQVELPHFAIQRGDEEQLPRYDYPEDDSEDGEDD